MAFRTHTLPGIARKASRDFAAESLAALPAGTIVGMYTNRLDAVGAAVQLSVDDPDARLWLASGEEASVKIRAARRARSLFMKLAGGLSDDEALVERIVAGTSRGQAVLVLEASGRNYLRRFATASHVVQFGHWTTREIAPR
jgi:hypothetical protein